MFLNNFLYFSHNLDIHKKFSKIYPDGTEGSVGGGQNIVDLNQESNTTKGNKKKTKCCKNN